MTSISTTRPQLQSGLSNSWDDFCSWYLEMIKPGPDGVIDADTYEVTIRNFEHLMALLHPYMPFITEEVCFHADDRFEHLRIPAWTGSRHNSSA